MAPKFKKPKLKAALTKLQTTHEQRKRATELRDRKEAELENRPNKIAKAEQKQQHQQQRQQQQQKQSTATTNSKKRLPPSPFSEKDSVLLIGEANFSFAKSLILHVLHRGDQVVATTLDREEVMQEKYGDGDDHVREVQEAGATVLFGVDGTKLDECKALKGKRFSKIVFNFPHAGAGIKDQDRNVLSNQKLLQAFFESAASFLTDPELGDKKPGEILVTIKTGNPYDLWNIKRLAVGTGLLGNKTSFPFHTELYPGYEHRRTIGFKDGVSQAGNAEIVSKKPKTYVFVKRSVKEEDMAKEAEVADIKKRKRAGEDVSDDED
ncbi:hypothetical protein DFQ27_007350 [Actinomortierella ambigua]|uniref:25S rRNA (uridine-N(3))-methyltransferase BMT5-like domain-containing protein n=1 Tax=Actinomortierella ambigua TaxID=1343610 RepID=A0A9P6PV61_9FUNG|nr:hypothetical protein DFQ27_007350 [Actinomortierella ambigua]